MTAAELVLSKRSRWVPPFLLMGIAAALTMVLALLRARDILPPADWWQATIAPRQSEPLQLLFHHSFLPRFVISVVAGAALGLAGALFQQILRNPLVEPATLGISAGAQLALSMAMLWAPGLLAVASNGIAFCGAMAAGAIVMSLAWRNGLSSITLIIAGLMVSLVCGAISGMLLLFNHLALSSLFIWQSGSLSQNGWEPACDLLVKFAVLASLSFLFVRPLEVIGLDDDRAGALGVSVLTVRSLVLVIATALSAMVVSAVGIIGFVGLAAPTFARLLGGRTLKHRLLWASLIGALLLALTDQLAQVAFFLSAELPAGVATGLLAAPTLLWLIPRLRHTAPFARQNSPPRRLSDRAASVTALIGVGILVLFLIGSLFIGQSSRGWHIATLAEFAELAPWRAPRAAGALASGAMLAAAGAMMQRVTGNPMAGPEVMGVSSGAAIGVITLMFLVSGFDPALLVLAASAGALLSLGLLLLLAARSGFSPEKLLLSGIALATLMSATASLSLASGDPRTASLLAWLSGSTYGVTASQATAGCVVAFVVLGLTPLLARWLEILPLGSSGAQAVGVNVTPARIVILLAIAVMTATATLVVGPLSFVGLLAPQIVRLSGIERPLPHLIGAALVGALIMVLADWLGRNIMFPWQIPTGLIASLMGVPYFLWLLRRR